MSGRAETSAPAVSVEAVDGGAAVRGELTFASVPVLAAGAAGWLRSGEATTLDLSAVTRADSAGLAMVLEWVAQARAGGGSLRLKAAPEQMLAIARASGLASLFADGE